MLGIAVVAQMIYPKREYNILNAIVSQVAILIQFNINTSSLIL